MKKTKPKQVQGLDEKLTDLEQNKASKDYVEQAVADKQVTGSTLYAHNNIGGSL